MGGSGSQRHREGVKDSVEKGTGALTWTLEGAGLGVGDLTGSTPFPQSGMRIVKKSRKGDGKNRVGIPDCVRTPPCELAPELRALALAWLRRAIRAHLSLRSAR